MKFKLNIVKQILTPIEVEGDDILEAVHKAYALIPETDTDHGKVGYTVDATPSDSMIKWHKEEDR